MSRAGELRPGEVVDGRFRLESALDDWGVGECWLALDVSRGETVALKFLPALGPTDHTTTTRFRELARALTGLRHRSIAATLHHGFWGGRPYLAQEHMPGVSLSKGFALARTGRHLLAPGVLANLLDRACEAVDAAHRCTPPLIHGGLLPGSIVAAMAAGRFQVRVVDFGLRGVFGDRIALARAAGHMVPELEDQPGHGTQADDVFALGAIVLEAVAEREGVGGVLADLSDVVTCRRDLPPLLLSIASRATRMEARHRHPDVASLRAALAAAWSPGTRPEPDPADDAPVGVAGVAAEFTSWLRFSEASPEVAPAAVEPAAPATVFDDTTPFAPPRFDGSWDAPSLDTTAPLADFARSVAHLGASGVVASPGPPAAVDLEATFVAAKPRPVARDEPAPAATLAMPSPAWRAPGALPAESLAPPMAGSVRELPQAPGRDPAPAPPRSRLRWAVAFAVGLALALGIAALAFARA